jgi:hypothetical protein
MLKWTSTPLDEHELFLNKQIDGIFTEFPHLTKAAYTKFKSTNTFPYSSYDCSDSLEKIIDFS